MALAQVAAGTRAVISHVNQFYDLLKGVTGETVTLIYNAAGSIKIQPSSDPAASTDAIVINNNAGTTLGAITYDGKFESADGTVALPGLTFDDDTDTGLYRSAANTLDFSTGGTARASLASTGLAMTVPVRQAKGADIASAATVDLAAATGNLVNVTGTTTITALGTVQAGAEYTLVFGGILTLTHNATSLILQGAANLTTAAGDVITVVSEGTGNWREKSRRLAAAAAVAGTTTKVYYVQLAADFSTTSAALVDVTNLTVTFTPASATNNIVVMASWQGTGALATSDVVLMEDGVNIMQTTQRWQSGRAGGGLTYRKQNLSAASHTYKIQTNADGTNAVSIYGTTNGGKANIVIMEVS